MKSLNIDNSITNRTEGSMKRYLSEIDKIPLLRAEEETLLCRKIQEGDSAALDKLVRANLRFVVSCSKKYEHMGLPISDLVNEGNMGLITAARKFDESRGFKFISYAVWWIRQSMMMALSRHSRMIYLPQSMIKVTSEIRLLAEKLEHALEREPTFEEIGEEMELDATEPGFEIAFGATVSSLDNTIQAESTVRVWEMMEDQACSASDCLVMEESVLIQVKGLLNLLSERERQIVKGFFGFGGVLPRSCDDLGKELELSAERVRQIRDRALSNIKIRVMQKGLLNAY